MPIQDRCPHCDSKNVEQMKDRSFESVSATTWYQCRDCGRMWNLQKDDTGKADKK
jgi:transposase-like protein